MKVLSSVRLSTTLRVIDRISIQGCLFCFPFPQLIIFLKTVSI